MFNVSDGFYIKPFFSIIVALFAHFDFVMADEESSVQGIDVSHYQGDVDWQAVSNAGTAFAFIKCTDSTTDKDSKFETNWAATQALGIPRGAYHFFHPEIDAVTQADFFLTCFDTSLGELPPVIDVERYKDDFAKLRCQDVIDKINAFAAAVIQKLNGTIIIYTNPSTWEQNMCSADIFDNYGIWIAEYSDTLDISSKWEKWNFWQYSQTGTIDGIDGNVDLNRFNGSTDQFQAYLR